MDIQLLRQAIELSENRMRENAGGPFGALVVKDGKVIGTGWNQVTSQCDPTAHAEINAIRDACRRVKNFALNDCEIYSSCEPCPMCLAAILWARIEKVYYAASCEDAAEAGFDDGEFYQELMRAREDRKLEMHQGLREEARAVFAEWLQKPDRIDY